MSPVRIQRKRVKGWRMPENTVYVGRPSKWGNPHHWQDYSEWYPDAEPDDLRRMATSDFKHFTLDPALIPREWPKPRYASLGEVRSELAGKDLACWCPLDQPCHADVLLEIANP
jgi:hypothetical protein